MGHTRSLSQSTALSSVACSPSTASLWARSGWAEKGAVGVCISMCVHMEGMDELLKLPHCNLLSTKRVSLAHPTYAEVVAYWQTHK